MARALMIQGTGSNVEIAVGGRIVPRGNTAWVDGAPFKPQSLSNNAL